LGSDLEEFLWTHEERLDEYPTEVQKLVDIALSLYKDKAKKIESEVSKPKPQPK
jgi:uncharacterized protein with von Willebrand factor type A (vWA) domain